MKTPAATYWKLFSSTFYLSAFTFGGGFVIIPLMKKKFVDNLHWIEEEESPSLLPGPSRSTPPSWWATGWPGWSGRW